MNDAIRWLTWQEARALEVHPTAKLLPKLLSEEFDALKQSIARDGGVSEPVLINRRGDTILDGRHRRDACVELKAEIPAIVYHGEDEKGIVIARGVLGRHLTDDQRLAFVIEAELDDLRAEAQRRIVEARHRNKMALPKPIKPIHVHEEIAKKAGVGKGKAQAAIEASDHDPKALKEVKEGTKRWRDVPKPKANGKSKAKSNGNGKKQPKRKTQPKSQAWLWFGRLLMNNYPEDQQPEAVLGIVEAYLTKRDDRDRENIVPRLDYPDGTNWTLKEAIDAYYQRKTK